MKSMTVGDVCEQAQRLLGYTNNVGFTNDADLRAKIIAQVNIIYADLYYACGLERYKKFDTVALVTDEVTLPDKVMDDCFIYGVCQIIAAAEGDADNQSYFAMMYNQKRSHCSHFEKAIDVFPMPYC